MGFIYSITSPSNKVYIGQTKRSVEERIIEHFKCHGGCTILENAIKKHGKDNMKYEILLEVDNNHLDEYEIKFIDMYDTLEPNGYNIRSGGASGSHSVESRMRMRDAKIGEKNHNFGKPRSDTCKLAISKAKSGERHHFYGKEFTIGHKIALSCAHRKSHSDLPMYVVFLKPRPEHYQSSGYAVVGHPILAKKYFTSKKLSDEEKLNQAIEYLHSA